MLTAIKKNISSRWLDLSNRPAVSGDERGVTIVELMIVIAVAALIIVLVLVAAPALQRNARNTQRRNDIGAIRGQLTTVFTNNNNTYPTPARFKTDVADQVEQAIYKDSAVPALLVGTASENKIYYSERFHVAPGGTTAPTEMEFDTGLGNAAYPAPDELYIVVGASCAKNTLGAAASANALGDSTKFDPADLSFATRKTASFIYQLEGETQARCEDNA